MVHDVLHPVSVAKVLRYEVVSSLKADIPDFDSVRCLRLPTLGSKIEKLAFAVFQDDPL
jgi:hypothetical protein